MRLVEEAQRGLLFPYRLKYAPWELGPKLIPIGNTNFFRKDSTLIQEGVTLQLSHYFSENGQRNKVVMLLHGCSGARLEWLNIINQILQTHDILSFDFQGSGMSQGQVVTMGVNQSRNIAWVHRLLTDKGYQNIYLWGRSMGATSAIKFCADNPKLTVRGIIADSPFDDLRDLVVELARKQINLIPAFVLQFLVQMIFNRIKERHDIDLTSASVKDKIEHLRTPILIVASKADQVVPFRMGKTLFERARSEQKKFVESFGGHGDQRQWVVWQQIRSFLGQEMKGISMM